MKKKVCAREGLYYIAGSLNTPDKLSTFCNFLNEIFGEKLLFYDNIPNIMFCLKTIFKDVRSVKTLLLEYGDKRNPQIWGPLVWKLLFIIASIVNRKLFEKLVNYYIQRLLPCQMCSNNWKEHIKNGPLTNENSNKEFIYYLYMKKFLINGTKPNFENVLALYLK